MTETKWLDDVDNEDGNDNTMVTRSKRSIVYMKDIYP